MVKHNNSIPKAHFKKKWKSHVKTWFDQSSKKKKRYIKRTKKLNVFCYNSNNLKNLLRPLVHSPTKLHNMRVKLGRGFSMKEILMTKISKKAALSCGISLDKRRRSKGLFDNFNFQRITKFFDQARFQTKKTSKNKLNENDTKFFSISEKLIKNFSTYEKAQEAQIPSTEAGISIHAFKKLRERKRN